MENRKKKAIITVIIVAIIIIVSIPLINKSGNCSMFGNNLSIEEEEIFTPLSGNYIVPRIIIKAKNTSNSTKTISFNANIYFDGQFYDSVFSNDLTLAKGDVGQFIATSRKTASFSYFKSEKWTYKITKWNTY